MTALEGFGRPDFGGGRTRVAQALDKMHAVAALQLVEATIHHAVAVEIQSRPFRGQNEPVITLRKEFRDHALDRRRMQLCLAALFLSERSKLRLCGLECIANGCPDISIRMPFADVMWFLAHHEMRARQVHIDMAFIYISGAMGFRPGFNGNPA